MVVELQYEDTTPMGEMYMGKRNAIEGRGTITLKDGDVVIERSKVVKHGKDMYMIIDPQQVDISYIESHKEMASIVKGIIRRYKEEHDAMVLLMGDKTLIHKLGVIDNTEENKEAESVAHDIVTSPRIISKSIHNSKVQCELLLDQLDAGRFELKRVFNPDGKLVIDTNMSDPNTPLVEIDEYYIVSGMSGVMYDNTLGKVYRHSGLFNGILARSSKIDVELVGKCRKHVKELRGIV